MTPSKWLPRTWWTRTVFWCKCLYPPYRRQAMAKRAKLQQLFDAINAEWAHATADRADEAEVAAWMAEQGFHSNTWTQGITEAEEVALQSAVTAFEARIKEIVGGDCSIYVRIMSDATPSDTSALDTPDTV